MSTHTKHTPGPWMFRTYSDGCEIVSTKPRWRGSMVMARLKGVSVVVDARIDDNQSNAHEASADARLICAAPDLLEALKELIEGVAILTPDAPTPVPGSIISNAIAAVAKAEGKRHD